MSITFSPKELELLPILPDALRALAEHHDCKSVEADAIGDFPESVKFHDARSDELRAEADRIQEAWEA